MTMQLNQIDIYYRFNALDVDDVVLDLQPRGGELDSPQSFVMELRNPDLKGERRLRVLESLRVSLTSKPVR